MTLDYQAGGNEVRITSATGGQKGQKSNRLGGADPLAMIELGMVYGFGEEKYDRFNYLKGYDWSLSIDALKRHLLAFEAGEDRDQESGLLHAAHVAWHGLALASFILRGVGTDDRAPALTSTQPGYFTCPLCSEPERVDDAVGGVCLTCADGIAFSQNLRRSNLVVAIGTPTGDDTVYGMSRADWDRYGLQDAVNAAEAAKFWAERQRQAREEDDPMAEVDY